MILLPVLTRELLVASRKKSTYWARVVASGVTIAMVLWMIVFSNAAAMGPAQQGRFILTFFTYIAFIYCLFAGADSTSDCISLEKREGTLGLLFLTDLKCLDLLIGKISATSLHHLYTLIAVMPMLSFCLLLGGVTGQEILFLALILLNTLFISISAGAFVSTFSVDQRKAMFGTGILLLGLVTGPWFLEAFARGDFDRISFADPVFLPLSPGFPLMASLDPTVATPTSSIMVSMALMHGLGWLLLVVAAGSLPGRIHQGSDVKLSKWGNFQRQLLYGNETQRTAYRRKLLDQNAYFWLTANERLKSSYSWLLFGLFFSLYFLVWLFARDLAVEGPFPILLTVTIHALYKCWVASEVSARLVEDRRVGAFELLLSTSMTPTDLSNGLNQALWRQFSKPIIATLVLDGWILLNLLHHSPNASDSGYIFIIMFLMAAFLLLDIFTLKWLAAWQALFSNKQGVVLSRVGAQVLTLPWVLTVMAGFALVFAEKILAPKLPFFSFGSMVAIWIFFSLLSGVVPAIYARSRFLAELRTIAANRFDARDRGSILAALYAGLFRRNTKRDQPFWIRHWIMTSAAVGMLLLTVAAFVRHNYWSGLLEEKLAALKIQGMPLSSQDLTAYLPYLPPSENGAMFLQQTAMLSPMPVLGPGLVFRNGLISEQMPLDKPLPPIVATNMAKLEKDYAAALKMLPSITNYSKAAITAKWSHPWMPFDQSLINIGHLVHGIYAHALMEIERGNFRSSEQSVHHLLLIYHFTTDYSSFQTQHLRRHMVIKASHLLERLISQGIDIDSPEFSRIESLLSKLEGTDSRKSSLIQVRAFAIETSTNSPSSIVQAMMPMGGNLQTIILSLYLAVEKKSGSFDKKLLAFLERMDQAIKACDLPTYREQIKVMKKVDALLHQERDSVTFNPLVPFSPFLDWLTNEHTFQIATFRLMRALILAERIRNEKGSVTPAEIQSQFPNDPYTSRPLSYRANEDHYLIYSWGPDMIDQGGMEVGKNTNKGSNIDLVIRKNWIHRTEPTGIKTN